jgi:hypothetical protein
MPYPLEIATRPIDPEKPPVASGPDIAIAHDAGATQSAYARRGLLSRAMATAFAAAMLAGCAPRQSLSPVASLPAPPVRLLAPALPAPTEALPTEALPPECVSRYAGLLDLATLAARYGRSSGLFIDALGDMASQLSACLDQYPPGSHSSGFLHAVEHT